MQVVVFKSNIKAQEDVCRFAPLFDLHPEVIKWSVDCEDIDNVLRIEGAPGLKPKKMRKLLRFYGVEVEELL